MINKRTVLEHMEANVVSNLASDGWANQLIGMSVEEVDGDPCKPISHAIEYRFEFKWTITAMIDSSASNDEFIAVKERAASAIVHELYESTSSRLVKLAYAVRSGCIDRDGASDVLMQIAKELVE